MLVAIMLVQVLGLVEGSVTKLANEGLPVGVFGTAGFMFFPVLVNPEFFVAVGTFEGTLGPTHRMLFLDMVNQCPLCSHFFLALITLKPFVKVDFVNMGIQRGS